MSSVVVILQKEAEERSVGEILDYLAKRFDTCGDDSWRNILAKGVLTDVMQYIFAEHDWSWQRQTGVINFIAGQTTYAVEPMWMKLEPMIELNGINSPVNEVSPSDFVYFSNTARSGRPEVFYRSGERSITVAPAPASDMAATWRGYIEPQWLITDERAPLPLPNRMYYLLKAGAEESLHAADNRFDAALRWQGRRFENMLDREIFRDRKGQRRSMQPRPNPPYGSKGYFTWTYSW